MGRWIRIMVAIVAVPVIPFLLFHQSLESWADQFLKHPPPAPALACIVAGLLATDVFLPVPSSFVSTLAGGTLPPWLALVASWIGLTVGAILALRLRVAGAGRWLNATVSPQTSDCWTAMHASTER